jgi:hypothetical protein
MTESAIVFKLPLKLSTVERVLRTTAEDIVPLTITVTYERKKLQLLADALGRIEPGVHVDVDLLESMVKND